MFDLLIRAQDQGQLALLLVAGSLALLLLSLTPVGAGFRKWAMARMHLAAQAKYEVYAAPRKARLFADLAGTVLEIGPGKGTNFDHHPDRVTRWIGIEPNRHMHEQLRRAGERRGIEGVALE